MGFFHFYCRTEKHFYRLVNYSPPDDKFSWYYVQSTKKGAYDLTENR